MLAKIRSNPRHVVLGVALVGIGLSLMLEHNYFIWPPILRDIGNDHGFDMVFVAIGVSLLIWCFGKTKNGEWDSINLFLAAFFMCTLSLYQFAHYLHTGIDMPWVSNAAITAFIVILAWRGDADGLD